MTPEPEAEIVQVAALLRRDQRFALMSAAECKGGEWWTTYGHLVCDNSLAAGGVLTELGRAVRARLAQSKEGLDGE